MTSRTLRKITGSGYVENKITVKIFVHLFLRYYGITQVGCKMGQKVLMERVTRVSKNYHNISPLRMPSLFTNTEAAYRGHLQQFSVRQNPKSQKQVEIWKKPRTTSEEPCVPIKETLSKENDQVAK
jgi:hypothetical protein